MAHLQTDDPASEAGDSINKAAAIQRVTLTGAILNTILSVAQLIGGFFSGSQALIADGFHTLSDLASDFVVLFAAHHAHKEADDNHPYGHRRIETLATILLALMLVAVAGGIFWQAWQRLSGTVPANPVQAYAMLFAIAAIAGKEALYHYTIRLARRICSRMLEANAWHHRSDVFSSIIVLIGIAGTWAGLPWLDPLAAMIVAGMILYMAGRMLSDSIMELVDTGLDPEKVSAISQFMAELPGVENVHMLRTRRMGGEVFADAHIQVGEDISVSEGHQVAEYVMQRLKRRFPEMADVTVHIDPENDEIQRPSAHLPRRAKLLELLQQDERTQIVLQSSQRMVLHYLNGKVWLDIFFFSDSRPDAQALDDFRQAAANFDTIGTVRFYRQID
ncbi:MAG TPA: cation diffusion facilitator family transporter [Thiolinea sp.]|nr:cation diffusion facilitator family transporter [Thiolinea sp.]